jgi:hypothetical protein
MFNIFVLALMAIIAGIAIRNFYVIFSQKSKITKTTRVNKPKKILCKSPLAEGSAHHNRGL